MSHRPPNENIVRLASFFATFAALAIATFPLCANAGTSTTTFTVTVTVPTSCTIAATNINFGTYDGANANATTNANANGTVSATCTQGTAPTIGLGAGANALATQRRLKDSATDYINYNLLQPPSSTPGAAVCGVIPSGQDVPVNGTGNVSYSDTVTATITF